VGGSSEKSGQTARENGEKWLDFEDFDMTSWHTLQPASF
jgi:hypothetical protein